VGERRDCEERLMDLVARTEWGAPATSPAADMPTALGVKIHWIGGHYNTPAHGDLCAAQVRAIRAEHLADSVNHWVDIAYNFVICQHGYVYEGRGLRKESGANGNQPLNLAHYAICAIQGTNEHASDDLKRGLRDAISYLRNNGAGPEILGHRDGYNTDCPGDELYAWVHAGAPRPGGDEPSIPNPTPAPSSAAWPGTVFRVKTPMMHSDDIRTWQARMAERGWRITVDGWYGPASRAVCLAFQAEKGLTQDGEVGKNTWTAAWKAPIT
jgi:putative peptidoglycan binding protein